LGGAANVDPGNDAAHARAACSHRTGLVVTDHTPDAEVHAATRFVPQSVSSRQRVSPPWYAHPCVPAAGWSGAQLHTSAASRGSSGVSWSKPTRFAPQRTISAVASREIVDVPPSDDVTGLLPAVAATHVLSSK
jgi:hypothetical protein